MKDPKNMVWLDLEMTGLEPERDTILEIATVVTDGQLNVLAEGPVLAIHHTESQLKSMDPWCIDHHTSSGLVERVRKSKTTASEAEEKSLEFIRRHCLEKTAPLCGNSVHQDRRFLVKYMPRLNDYLHYRIVDVSSVKEIVERWYPKEFQPNTKKKSHLALEDIRESIAELEEYRRLFFRPPAS